MEVSLRSYNVLNSHSEKLNKEDANYLSRVPWTEHDKQEWWPSYHQISNLKGDPITYSSQLREYSSLHGSILMSNEDKW